MAAGRAGHQKTARAPAIFPASAKKAMAAYRTMPMATRVTARRTMCAEKLGGALVSLTGHLDRPPELPSDAQTPRGLSVTHRSRRGTLREPSSGRYRHVLPARDGVLEKDLTHGLAAGPHPPYRRST